MNLQELTYGEANVEARVNELMESLKAAGAFSKNHETTSGLTWGYYGCDDYNGNTIANGTVTLTDNATNYVVVLRSTGVVSVSTTTTNATDPLYARLYKVTTVSGAVTAEVDERLKANGFSFVSSASGTVTSVDASGGVETVSGSAITGSGTVRGAHAVNAQTGTTYTYVTGDRGKLVTHSNASAIAGTLPQAGTTGFETKWFMWVQNRGAGTLTITPTTSTIDGSATLALTTGQGALIVSDGTNYYTMRGVGGSGGSVAGSNKQVQYNNSGSLGAEAGFEYDASTNTLSVPQIKAGAVDGEANGISGDDEHWVYISNDPSVVAGLGTAGKQLLRVNSYGSGGYGGNVHFCRYRGTKASPTAVQSGDYFSSFGWRGWDSGAALSQSAAAWQVIATENWTAGAHGIKFRWEVTPNGSITRGLGMELSSTGLAITGGLTTTTTVAATGNVTGANLSGTNTGDQLTFKTISVSGQSDVVADSATDTLTLVAGTNVTITTNATTDSITIAATGGGGSLSDADYGDITVSGTGTVMTIDNDVVTNAKAANMATSTIKGRTTAGTGDPEDLTAAQAAAILQGDGLTVDLAGFRGIPQNSQSAAYTLVASDAGKHILHPSSDANARTFTIPANSSVAYPVGTALTFVNQTSQVVTIAITTDTMTLAGTTTTGSRSLAQNGMATALKVASTSWIISGSGLT